LFEKISMERKSTPDKKNVNPDFYLSPDPVLNHHPAEYDEQVLPNPQTGHS